MSHNPHYASTGTCSTFCLRLFACIAASLAVPTAFGASGNCTPDHISLNSPALVNSFQTDHGPCDHVVGNLIITDGIYTSLSGLADLTSIGGDLLFQYSTVYTVADLSNLQSVGGQFRVEVVQVLDSFAGLNSLTSIGSLIVEDSDQLTTIGFPALAAINGGINILNNDGLLDTLGLSNTMPGGDIDISNNNALQGISGLPAAVIASLRVRGNPVLTTLDASGLIDIQSNLWVEDNPLLESLSLPPVSSLEEVIIVNTQPPLTHTSGLAPNSRNAASTNAKPGATGVQQVGLNLDSLSNLVSVLGVVAVSGNPTLGDCSGLGKLLDQVDDGEPGPGPGPDGIPDVAGGVQIESNLPGCNSVEEVLASVGDGETVFADGFEDQLP